MTNKRGRNDLGMSTVRWLSLGVSLRQQNAIASIDIFSLKKKYSYDRCPNSVNFDTRSLIKMSAIKICIYREIEFDRVYFLLFCNN